MKLFSFITLLFYSSFSFADVCSEVKCPSGRQNTKICFVGSELWSGPMWKANSTAACGYFTDVKVVNSIADVKRELQNLTNTCKSLDKLIFQGHGDDGHLSIGDLDSGSVSDLAAYSCLFNRGANIYYSACSVGRSCSGDMFMFQSAKNLLTKGGTVDAPTTYISTFLPGVIPPFALNGKYRRLSYTPSKSPMDSWTQTGLAITNGGDINERCSDNLKELMDEYSTAKVAARKKSCRLSNDYVNDDRLNSYRTIQTKLSRRPPPYLQSASSDAWYDLSSAISTLKYQIRRYEQCEPPQPDKGNSRSTGAVR